MPEHIYLDTGMLVPLLWDRDPDQQDYCQDRIDALRGQVRSYDDKHVKIPKLALGEAVSRYFEDVRDGEVGDEHVPARTDLVKNIHEVLDATEAELQSVQTECHEIARELRRDDRELGYNDLYIAATALADSHSTYLLALDSDLITSRSIQTVGRRRHSDGKREYPLQVDNRYTDP